MATRKVSGSGGTAQAGSAKRGRASPQPVVLERERQRMAMAVAYFKAARHRDVGADGCRADDECKALMELDRVLKSHQIRR